MGRDGKMASRHQNPCGLAGKCGKEDPQSFSIARGELGKSRQWLPDSPVKGRRDSPYSAFAFAQLLMVGFFVLEETVGGGSVTIA